MKEKTKNVLKWLVVALILALMLGGIISATIFSNNGISNLKVADAYSPVGLQFNQLYNYTWGVDVSNTDKSVNVTYIEPSYTILSNGANPRTWLHISPILNFNLISNHKYYINYNKSTNDFYNIYITFNKKNGGVINIDNTYLFTCNDTYFQMSHIGLYVPANATLDSSISPILIDLTIMFGAGNEPKTVEDVQKYICKDTYYPYTPIVDYDQIEKDAFNQGMQNAQNVYKDLFSYISYSPAIAPDDTIYKKDLIVDDNNNAIRNFQELFYTWDLGAIAYYEFIPSNKVYLKSVVCTNGDTIKLYVPIDVDINKVPKPSSDGDIYHYFDSEYTKLVSHFDSYFDLMNYFEKNGNSYIIIATELHHLIGYIPDISVFDNLTLQKIKEFQSNNGYSSGYESGYDVGYNKGNEVGNTQGYNKGKADGLASANKNTFMGLIGATIDAPINAFTKMFDFEILGFNMKTFMLSILTLGLVILIVRLCLGGK